MMFSPCPDSSTPPQQPQQQGGGGYPPLRNVVRIHPHDVLCGRGLTVNKHVGNKMWRDLIQANRKEYASLPRTKRQQVTSSIVMAVRSLSPPGRFLMLDNRTGTFYDIGDQKANMKTSQAMRDTKKKKRPVVAPQPPVFEGVETTNSGEYRTNTNTTITSPYEEAYALVPPPLTRPVTMSFASVTNSCCVSEGAATTSHHVSLATNSASSSSALALATSPTAAVDNNNNNNNNKTGAVDFSPIPTMVVACPPRRRRCQLHNNNPTTSAPPPPISPAVAPPDQPSPSPTSPTSPPIPMPCTPDRLYSDDTFDQEIQNLGIVYVPPPPCCNSGTGGGGSSSNDSVISLVSLEDLEESEINKLTDSCCMPVNIELNQLEELEGIDGIDDDEEDDEYYDFSFLVSF